ncbi:peptidoglycan-recognition protein 2-like isoform X2 [Plodia interpunctella]|uniref:peptidoglycan-recognition protein 2-like isoform X2 n=1 Tax=Plodia interpunctella TaxID=58824 RepID=UPI002368C8A6|nr:peptidoglycan-recognition protein 2-like isoform X2 [Plodia interpunctella]
MQPLISPIDHESRQSSVRVDEATAAMAGSEDTPLLARFPRPQGPRNPMTTAVVSTLLIILISGIIIGIYLLILQSEAENILPPVEAPLKLISLHQWDPSKGATLSQSPAPFKTSQVIVVQTDTESCFTAKTCEKLLRDLKANSMGSVPYNFLISSDGQTYEALGWHSPSALFPNPTLKTALVIAFIGNFTENPPSDTLISEGKTFFIDSISRQHLDPNFILIGKKTKYFPKYLFLGFKDMSQWSDELSDSS